MMKEDKYYIPTIEEFHVNFEYEFHGMTTRLMIGDFTSDKPFKEVPNTEKEIWHKETIKKDYFNTYPRSLQDIEDLIESKQIRVKYLNEKDILSLGFVSYDEYVYTSDDASITLFINTSENNVITISSWGEAVFYGYLKNKSELIRLLKQLDLNL